MRQSGIEQTMQVDDEITHMRIVDGLLRLRTPRDIGARVIRIDADDIDLGQVLEFDVLKPRKLATDNQVKKLLLWSLIRHDREPV